MASPSQLGGPPHEPLKEEVTQIERFGFSSQKDFLSCSSTSVFVVGGPVGGVVVVVVVVVHVGPVHWVFVVLVVVVSLVVGGALGSEGLGELVVVVLVLSELLTFVESGG